MLEIFSNLLFTLLSSSGPFYNQLYAIIKALREYLPNTRAALQHNNKTSILWMILFKQGGFHKEIWWDITDALDSSPVW